MIPYALFVLKMIQCGHKTVVVQCVVNAFRTHLNLQSCVGITKAYKVQIKKRKVFRKKTLHIAAIESFIMQIIFSFFVLKNSEGILNN